MHHNKNSFISQEDFTLAKKIASMNPENGKNLQQYYFSSLNKTKFNLFQNLKSDMSAQLLLLTNILILIIAILQQWPFSTLIATYFIQNLIIGFFHFFRIIYLKNIKKKENTAFTAFFFLVHYGIFHFVYFIFLKIFFVKDFYISAIILPSLLLFFNHLFSFFYNKSRDEKKMQDLSQIMFEPYLRILPMHLIIIFGGFISFSIFSFNSTVTNSILLLLFLLLKTSIDLIQHTKQHEIGEFNK
ncbi:MAG: DUF6498-containing protein [Nanoarchaeota archaeon]